MCGSEQSGNLGFFLEHAGCDCFRNYSIQSFYQSWKCCILYCFWIFGGCWKLASKQWKFFLMFPHGSSVSNKTWLNANVTNQNLNFYKLRVLPDWKWPRTNCSERKNSHLLPLWLSWPLVNLAVASTMWKGISYYWRVV